MRGVFMEKIMRKIKPLYLAVGVIVLLVILAAALYFIFVRNNNFSQNRGTYVLNASILAKNHVRL